MDSFWQILKRSGQEFGEDRAPRLAAALAYYTVFSLAPLLVILIGVLGLVFGEGDARSRLVGQLEGQIGPDAAGLIGSMIEQSSQDGSGVVATVVGTLVLLVGATGIFVQLQGALNEIWDVRPDPGSGFMRLLWNRVTSLGMVLVLGLLLLVSFVLQTAMNIVINNLGGLLPGADVLWYVANLVVTLALVTVVFAAIFKVLPDAEVSWRDVWIGAFVTALLFKIGEVLIGLYLGMSGVRSSYGAAGSLVVLLLWIYYSAQIVLFGAELTQVYARRRRGGVEPPDGAVRQA